MGYYIEVPKNKGKAEQLVELHNGVIINRPNEFQDVPKGAGLVCVVDNGIFEAAAFCFSEEEFRAFSRDSGYYQRPRKWVLLDLDLARELSGFGG